MKYRNFTYKAGIISALFWLIDSMIHKFIYSEHVFELIPSEINELWMRVIIVLLLITFGIYADKHTQALLNKEQEKRVIFNATIGSTQHILNNLLNQMQYFKLKADETGALDTETNDLYVRSIEEGKELIQKLSNVDKLTEKNIKESVYPRHQ